jgi:hypothetical protein
MSVCVGELGLDGEVGCDHSIPSQPRSQLMPQLIPPPEIASLLVVFAPWFTSPSFHYFTQFVWVMMVGWGRRLTTTVCLNDVAERHHTNYARFLGRYRWEPLALAQGLLDLLLSHLPPEAIGERVTVAMDDRPVAKSRGKMPGLGWHHCHNRGACAGPFVHGHIWVQIALVARLGQEAFSLPLRALMYRRQKDCRRNSCYKEKWRLGLELLDSLVWPHGVRILADGNFYVKQFARQVLEAGHDLIVRMPKVGAVHWQPKPQKQCRGRPRIYGRKTSLQTAFRRARCRHIKQSLWGWHGRLRVAEKVLVSRLIGQPCKIVCVRLANREPRYLLCTDLSLSAEQIVRLYATRFSIEITFRELTQRCGFGDYQVRKPRAIEAHVQLSQIACSLLYLLIFDDSLPIDQFPWPAWRSPKDHLSLGQTQQFLRQIAFSAQLRAAHTAKKDALWRSDHHVDAPAAA